MQTKLDSNWKEVVIPSDLFTGKDNSPESGTSNKKNPMNKWLPKSVLCLKSYTKRLFLADLLSGITVGLVALPLAMAFAIASGSGKF